MTKARLDEISLVDRPAQAGAKVVLRKRDETAPNILPQDDAGRLIKGTDPGTTPAVIGGNQEIHMTPEEKAAFEKAAQEKLESMQKRAERAEQIATLTDGQKSLFEKMEAKEQDSFLALSPEARQSQVSKALESNSVVYTSLEGEEFRKNDDPRLVALAKRADKDRTDRIEAEKVTKRERLAKRAGELDSIKGDADTKIALLEVVDGLPVEKRAKVEELLKAANSGLKLTLTQKGVNGDPTPDADSAQAKLDAMAKRLQDANPKLSSAQAMNKVLKTPEGMSLQDLARDELLARRN